METPDRPRVDALGRPRLRASIKVVSNLGWEGELSAADLVPALLNPHTLIERRGGGQPSLRRLSPPTRTEIAYVFPQDRRPTLGLADYISHGERNGIHERQLVCNNADGARWWRQRRAVLRPAWALPYNSGYDYGSHENAAGLVINGRFVGVDPSDEIDKDLLGGALLSTFPIVTRLQEGVATGTEGAYDVGPPAAKLMRIPDVRKFKNAAGVSAVRDVLGALRAQNLIPPAPDRKGNVDLLRRSLDEAILKALGLSAGESAVLLDEVYSSYAEWRSATEDVETRMREHRRAMAQSGRTRTQAVSNVSITFEYWIRREKLPPSSFPSSTELDELISSGAPTPLAIESPLSSWLTEHPPYPWEKDDMRRLNENASKLLREIIDLPA